jgi:hypothetical protein
VHVTAALSILFANSKSADNKRDKAARLAVFPRFFSRRRENLRFEMSSGIARIGGT